MALKQFLSTDGEVVSVISISQVIQKLIILKSLEFLWKNIVCRHRNGSFEKSIFNLEFAQKDQKYQLLI